MIQIYVDGACKTSSKTGGWAFVVIDKGKKIYSKFGPEEDTTNNRMEIMACIKALEYCIENNIKETIIISDSMYVVGTMSQKWERNKNHDLWKIMDGLCERVKVIWQHVKGHNDDKWNNLCDVLAVAASNYQK